MHHLIEIIVVLLVALIIGWLIGWFLRCVLFRGSDARPRATTEGRGKLGVLEGGAAAGVAAAASAATLQSAPPAASKPASKPAASKPKAPAAPAKTEEKPQAYGLSGPIGGKADDLQLISGVGPKLEKMLHDLGIYHFSQIAGWTKKDIAEVDDKLKFKGRIEREEWVRQAKLLAAGKMAQFEKEYGTGGKKDASGKSRAGSRTRKSSTGKSAPKAASGAATKGGKGKAGKKEKPQAYGLSGPIGGKADDLQLLSGVGPKLEKVLHDLGIYHFSQIAGWTKKDIAEVDGKLKFKGRIEREEWVRQAKLLAAGKMAQFEKEYGTGGKKDASGKSRAGSRTRKK